MIAFVFSSLGYIIIFNPVFLIPHNFKCWTCLFIFCHLASDCTDFFSLCNNLQQKNFILFLRRGDFSALWF